MITYPNKDSSLSFAEYIAKTREQIIERRPDLQTPNPNAETIINANSPFELIPAQPIRHGKKYKYGVLMVHGLLDSPFSVRDVGKHLQNQGMLCRSVLLPGHGTMPSDLLEISYEDWINVVSYGIASLQKEVEHIYILGYSTGATLAAYHATKNSAIAGIIVLSPAIKVKAPIRYLLNWHYLMKRFKNHRDWLYHCEEVDYAKYLSIPYNAIAQVNQLTDELYQLGKSHRLTCPIFMAVSANDETISSHAAINYFKNHHNHRSQLIIYREHPITEADMRIINRSSIYPPFKIKQFSHVSLPFPAMNPHYGQEGDYVYAAHAANSEDSVFGAYNNVDVRMYDLLYSLGITKVRRRELTYNPDFDFMINKISDFVLVK